MNFENFVTEFLHDLKNNDKHAITLLDKNGKLIKEYFDDEVNVKTLDNFTRKIGRIILENYKGKYDVIGSALKHKTMTTVYQQFRESDVMINAFQMNNKNAVKWLQTMNISPYVQNEQGRNALMYAVQNAQWNPYIKQYASNEKCINQVDKNGRSALFYAVNNLKGLTELIRYSNNINMNQIDNKGNNVLLYCCKNEFYSTFEYLVKNTADVNAVDHDGRSVIMHLAIQGKYSFIPLIYRRDCNINYMNMRGETALSLLLNQMYGPEGDKDGKFNLYTRTIIALASTNCNFNIPMDEDENTALMVMLLANDIDTFNFVVKFSKKVDLSIKNRYGENATSIFMKNKRNYNVRNVIKHSTFDYSFVDPINRNTILMITAITQPSFVDDVVKNRPRLLNDVNVKGENALMLACKDNQLTSVTSLINQKFTYFTLDINAQDQLGNTALYYAVARQNPIMVYQLLEKGADRQIVNLQGKSVMELAKELGDPYVLDALQGRMTIKTIKKITPLYQGNEKGDLMMSREIDEYLYYCVGTNAYSNFRLTDNMVKAGRINYLEVESKVKKNNGNTNDDLSGLLLLGIGLDILLF